MSRVVEIVRRKRKLSAAFARGKAIGTNPTDDELRADYARHLCVLVSGFIERSIAEIILAYAKGKSTAPLQTYLESSLRKLTNVDKERLLQVIGSLDHKWRLEVDAFVVDERQAALNSVVGLRNDIAHGGGGSVSLLQVEKYWIAAQEIIDKVEAIVLPLPGGHKRQG